MEVGIRVVRGPDWKWANQDDGEGHVGTVVEIGKPLSSLTPNKTVVVQWDCGTRTNYRAGYQGAFDLRVVDSAAAGVRHPNIVCDGCNESGVYGIHWKCANCSDYDLCSYCYMNDIHDTTHVFQRFESPTSTGILMRPRVEETKIHLKGIFVGAKVVRGHDWDWGNQDGGEGKPGRVIDIRGWDSESGRSVANVTWKSGATNVYRLGHKGKVDLRCVEAAIHGYYYREHLPVFGQCAEQVLASALTDRLLVRPTGVFFSVGDRVKVVKDEETLKAMQEGHGGWNPRMAQYIGKVGTVHRVTERGDIRVQYEGCSHRWTFNPEALSKRNCFAVGDLVRVINDFDKFTENQEGHGEWIEIMKKELGKVGKVVKVYDDGDLRVTFVCGETWTLNPLNVKRVSQWFPDFYGFNSNNNLSREERRHPSSSLLPTSKDVTRENRSSSRENRGSAIDVVREAAQGHLETVREYLVKYPEKVDYKSKCRTCLQVASHQGHVELVKLLLALGGSFSLKDDDGDTALHYSAFGNQPEIMELLLKAGADANTTNRGSCTPLHVAVNKQHVQCVTVLLRFKCDVNIQDSYGDTALHDAIGKENVDITVLLCNVTGVDFTLRNFRGFNVLHHAALKGNNHATEQLLRRSPQLVDRKKDDGFAALHLACLNGHLAVAKTLLEIGKADVDLVNDRRQTPLLLAVSQGHCSLVELCINKGANAQATDEEGDTALHIVLMKRSTITAADISEQEAPSIFSILAGLRNQPGIQHIIAVAISCYLIQHGASLVKKNKKGKSPLDLLVDNPLSEVLRRFSVSSSSISEPSISGGSEPSPDTGESNEGVGASDSPVNTTANNSSQEELYATSRKSRPVMRTTTTAAANNSDGIIQSAENSDSIERNPPGECAVCSEVVVLITFIPCNHRIACEDCCPRMKKCLKCGDVITNRITDDGQIVPCKSRQSSADRLRYLEEIEDAICCSICMERRRNVAFLCGHGACDKCSLTLKICHMCRTTITKKINLY